PAFGLHRIAQEKRFRKPTYSHETLEGFLGGNLGRMLSQSEGMQSPVVVATKKGIAAFFVNIDTGAPGYQESLAVFSGVVNSLEPALPTMELVKFVENDHGGVDVPLLAEDLFTVFVGIPIQISAGFGPNHLFGEMGFPTLAW